MTPAVIIITVLCYVALLATVAAVSARGADNRGFFVGARRSQWWMAMVAMVGAAFSGVTYVSVPGMVATSGWSYMQMAMGFVVGYFVIAFLLVPLFYRMGLVSIYGYLAQRFGTHTHRTGAWLFFISKLLGAAVRLYVICAALQPMLFEPLGVPFAVNCLLTVLLVWGYTFRGGVQSLIWTDMLKTVTLVASIALAVWAVADGLDLTASEAVAVVRESDMSQLFFFDDARDGRYFFKQFFAAIFLVVAMTGLDQDMMQRTLSCRDMRGAQKNMMLASVLQAAVIFALLVLGVLLYEFAAQRGIALSGSTDEMFPRVASAPEMPLVVGILFVLGLVASTYSAAGSSMTALTTSFTIDVLHGDERADERSLARLRKWVHVAMAVAMAVVVLAVHYLSNSNVIDVVYTLGSYSYGPILGLFCFGIFTRRTLRERAVVAVVVAAPALCLLLQRNSERWFGGYTLGYEVMILNALLTFVGLWAISRKPTSDNRA